MYSVCYKRPILGYISPPPGARKLPLGTKNKTATDDFQSRVNVKRNGAYGRVKDPFKAYRNSKHHVMDMTRYYDRKEGKDEESPEKTEMTFRRFRPRSAYTLVKDEKQYFDPRAQPHFIYNRNVYDSLRSSLGTRQRLDGSTLEEQQGSGENPEPAAAEIKKGEKLAETAASAPVKKEDEEEEKKEGGQKKKEEVEKKKPVKQKSVAKLEPPPPKKRVIKKTRPASAMPKTRSGARNAPECCKCQASQKVSA